MKSIALALMIFATVAGFAQAPTGSGTAQFDLGSGLNFHFNDSAYVFKISGMVQPYFAFSQLEDEDPEYFLNSRRTYFNISGRAMEEKVSFFVQTDFSLRTPLLDAWIAYHPTDYLTITAGQKQSIANNREMLFMEDQLQFAERSILSTDFSETGREFGLFVDGRFAFGGVGVIPQVAVTSGDGRNSFGSDSRDVDLGGLKYAGRIDVYPLGFFKEGNGRQMADLYREDKLKMVIGGAASYNDGASNVFGEGHGEFFLYNEPGQVQLPDYRQLYADILLKLKGFSLLAEYSVSTGTGLEGIYTDENGTEPLRPEEIAGYLALGSAYNAHLSYVTTSGIGFDLRYSQVTPEFEDVSTGVSVERSESSFGITKYLSGNNLKVQAAISSIEDERMGNTLLGTLYMQLIF